MKFVHISLVLAVLFLSACALEQPEEFQASSDYLSIPIFSVNGTVLDGQNHQNWSPHRGFSDIVQVSRGTEYALVISCANITIPVISYQVYYSYGIYGQNQTLSPCVSNTTVYSLADKGLVGVRLNFSIVNTTNSTGNITAFIVAK